MTKEKDALVSFPEPVSDYDLAARIDNLLFDIQKHSKVKRILEEKGSLGGYLCIARAEDGFPLAIIQFGYMPPDKLAGRFEFCQEKARRLASNPEHMTSWQSRDPSNNKWGGAIRGKKYIYSISGLPEQLDEVLSALFAIDVDDLDVDIAKASLSANYNDYYVAKLDESHSLWEEAA